MDLLIDPLLSESITKLLQIVIYVAKTTANFKPELGQLQNTLKRITPIIQDIVNLNRELGITKFESQMFTVEIQEAEKLVRKCSKIKRNRIKRYTHSLKLKDVNKKLLQFFQLEVQAVQTRDGKQTLVEVNNVSQKLDSLYIYVREMHQIFSCSSMSIADGREQVGQCRKCNSMSIAYEREQVSQCEFDRDKLGCQVPGKKLKDKILADDDSGCSMDTGGCGKTTLVGNGAVSTITAPTYQYKDLEKFKIPLEDIEEAIGERKRIGNGAFGMVYKGQISQNRTAAIKIHDPKGSQGKDEFRNELAMLSRFHHQNIIPFIGYYDEGDHMIIVSEYATNGSLDDYLRDLEKRSSLTWVRRLEICLGAAKGLNYLHSGLGDDDRVIHRDIKSANILLDDNLEAKICDFGLSISRPRNQPKTQIYTKVAGTNFYMDPIYRESGILRKESDVYSFGVVLFEMLSGMLSNYGKKIGTDKPATLLSLVRRLYDEGLEEIIDPVMKDQLDPRSFDKFKEIAHDCISYNIKERPTMETVIERIEEALNYQLSQTRRN